MDDASTPIHAQYAIAIADFVDTDELYPYRRDTHARHDTTGAIMFVPVESESGFHIAMTAWSNVRIRMPARQQDQHGMVDLDNLEDLMQWCKIIPTVMKERLALRQPARPTKPTS